MFCSNCGKEIADNLRFCASCGNPVGSAAAPPVPVEPSPAIFGASFIDAQASMVPGEKKKRHGCLTAYLILVIIANSALALVCLLASDTIRGNLRSSSEWVVPVLIPLALVNLVCAIGLFQWKEWVSGATVCPPSWVFLLISPPASGFSSRSWASPESSYYTACSILALTTRGGSNWNRKPGPPRVFHRRF